MDRAHIDVHHAIRRGFLCGLSPCSLLGMEPRLALHDGTFAASEIFRVFTKQPAAQAVGDGIPRCARYTFPGKTNRTRLSRRAALVNMHHKKTAAAPRAMRPEYRMKRAREKTRERARRVKV